MLCPHCGSFVPDDASACPECAAAFRKKRTRRSPRPAHEYRDWLGASIALTVCSVLCACGLHALPFGILGIVFSCISRSALERNDTAQAESKASLARIMIIIGVCIIAAELVLLLLFRLFPGPILSVLEQLALAFESMNTLQ